MVTNGNQRLPMVTNGTKWYQMVPNGTRWYPMVPDGTQWSSVTQINLYMLAEWSNAGSGQSNFRWHTSGRNLLNVNQGHKGGPLTTFFYFLFAAGGCHSQKRIYVFLRDVQMQAWEGQN